MKITGEILKKAREQKGLSINEIALSLKISSKILRSIEDGDTSQLPAKTFLRGFVQSYASYLRLDVNEVLKVFQEEMGSTNPSPLLQSSEEGGTPSSPDTKNSSAAQEKNLNGLARNSNSKTVTVTIFGLVLVGLIIFTKKMVDKYQKESAVSEVEITTPLMTLPADIVTSPTPTSDPAGATATVSPTPAPSPVATTTPLVAATTTPAVTPKATPTATPAPTATASPTPAPTATPTPTPAPTSSPTPSPSPSPAVKAVEVIIEALDNVAIEFATRDGKTGRISLSAEQVHTFKSKDGLRLNINNGGAVNVIVNGKDLGIPGNLGKPVKLNF